MVNNFIIFDIGGVMNTQENSQNSGLIFHALDYAKKGWAILPLHNANPNGSCSCGNPNCSSSAKHPRTRNGSKDASTNPMALCQWWQQWPEANIGIATGEKSGIVVIDIDPRHGGDKSWMEFTTKFEIPDTLTSATGGGGFHIYFKAGNFKIKNRTNVLPGVDIRGEGGYVVAPSSVHISGSKYEWMDIKSLAELPKAIINLINKPNQSHEQHQTIIPLGARNNTLASFAGLLRKQGLSGIVLKNALEKINSSLCSDPLPTTEIEKIARSISKYPNESITQSWSKPLPLPDVKTLVPKMTEDYLPEAIKHWAADICDRMQIPFEFIAAPVVIGLSTVIGRQVCIYPKEKDNWYEVPNLWGAVIARPGFFKSPAISEALKPLDYLVEEARTKYEAELIISKSKEDVLKAKIEGIKDNVKKSVKKGNQHEIDALQTQLEETLLELEENKIVEKRYRTNDATIEKIGVILHENPTGILVFRDELSGWLKNLEKVGREGDRAFFLESWSGKGQISVDRIGRGTLHIPSLTLSIFGGLQPGKLDGYIHQTLQGGEGDDGLIQRFQVLVYPELNRKWKNVDRSPNSKHQETVLKLFKLLSNLNTSGLDEQTPGIPGLRFSRTARELFVEWREELENRLGQGLDRPAFSSHISKYRKLVPSLSLIFHLCKYPDLKEKAVEREAVELALRWSKLLEAHAKKVYSSVLHSEITSGHTLAKKIQSGDVTDGMTVRSIYRKGWSKLESSKQVDQALALLEDLNWLRVEQIKGTTKPKEEVFLNPQLSSRETPRLRSE